MVGLPYEDVCVPLLPFPSSSSLRGLTRPSPTCLSRLNRSPTGGVYDDLTLWEQIDDGAQYTPAKKYLTSVPIGLYVPPFHPARRLDFPC